MMAVLPCMLSYGWIFKEILGRSPEVLDTVYGPFVKNYARERYEKLCQSWIDNADKACAGLSVKSRRD